MSSLHDKVIRDLRKLGKIPYLGTITKSKVRQFVKQVHKVNLKKYYRKTKPYFSENGSLLPNKYASWEQVPDRFLYHNDKDF